MGKWVAVGVAFSELLSGCLELQHEETRATTTCTACHGNATRKGDQVLKAAPPFDVDGNSAISARGVGAHSIHLNNDGHAAIACNECHQVPETTFSKGHLDSRFPAEVTFGSLASQNGHHPSYDPATLSCQDTYCHGDVPHRWTHPRDQQSACGTCHDLPPPAPHPPQTECHLCHGAVIDNSRHFVRPELHVNGTLELAYPSGCSVCHGSTESPAPPPDLTGNRGRSARGVGAHEAHLRNSASHAAVACNECHTVPQTVDAPSHLDARSNAEIVFGPIARALNHSPAYSDSDMTCKGSYCHGKSEPKWTSSPGDAENGCGSCHDLPPALPHPQDNRCEACHSEVMGAAQTVLHPELHVNGLVEHDSQPKCSGCHGTGSLGAVPPDLSGNTDPSTRGVGAHTAHLTASDTHEALPCATCHEVPSDVNATSHLDGDGRAEVLFAASANVNNHTPSYNLAEASCVDTYCHGGHTIRWQNPRTSKDACGSCHGTPPPLPHPARNDCSSCHGSGFNTGGEFVNAQQHVNGIVDINDSGCSLCHGSNKNAAPPLDLSGSNDPNRISIGAHQAHLAGGRFSRPLSCSECHIVPTEVDQPSHLDNFDGAEVTFSGPALTRSRQVDWVASTASCTGSYCHDPSGNGSAAPKWNEQGVQFTCTSCHGMPPEAPHVEFTECSFCHSTVDANQNVTMKSRHVDGVVDF